MNKIEKELEKENRCVRCNKICSRLNGNWKNYFCPNCIEPLKNNRDHKLNFSVVAKYIKEAKISERKEAEEKQKEFIEKLKDRSFAMDILGDCITNDEHFIGIDNKEFNYKIDKLSKEVFGGKDV